MEGRSRKFPTVALSGLVSTHLIHCLAFAGTLQQPGTSKLEAMVMGQAMEYAVMVPHCFCNPARIGKMQRILILNLVATERCRSVVQMRLMVVRGCL